MSATLDWLVDWDQWRADYDTLDFAGQQSFYAAAGLAHPVQRHYNAEAATAFLELSGARAVVEVGGWDGALAADTITDRVESWTNLEICSTVTPVCDDPRYEHVLLRDFPWNYVLDGDALILSHVAEHIRLRELAALARVFTGGWVYIDCPVTEGPQDWTGYEGSHVIEEGWDGIEKALAGFERVARWEPTARAYHYVDEEEARTALAG
jgi:hypothetical protein